MLALYILGALVLLIVLVLLLRVGVHVSFGKELRIDAKVGPVKIAILPKAEKEEKKPQTSEGKPAKKKPKFTFEDIRQALPVLFDALKKALGKTRRRMRVDPLQLSVTFAGEDPSRVAELYGWANTAMWTLMPQLEQLLRIHDPHIHLEVDYQSFTTTLEGEVGLSFRVGDLLNIVLTLAIPVLRWYLAWQKEEKPSVNKEQPTTV